MDRLHTTYHNLGSWKLVREADHSAFKIVYNSRLTVISAVILFGLCVVIGILLYRELPATPHKNPALAIIAATGILTPGIMIGYAKSQIAKPPLLIYHPAEDLLIVRDPTLEIRSARKRISFSRERFKEHSEYYFEFNIVVDGERMKFLSCISDSFKPLTRDLVEMGFHVSEHSIKL